MGAQSRGLAAGSPTLFPAAWQRCRSHSRTVSTLADRNLSGEASQPGSASTCRCALAGPGSDTPATVVDRVTTVFTRTASAVGGALALCDGSDLLPLRLPWHCSWVFRWCRPPQSGGFAKFARFARSPNMLAAFAFRLCRRSLLARLSRPAHMSALAHSSNPDPSGPLCQSMDRSYPMHLTRLGRDF